MSFALDHMREAAASGAVARVVVAATKGSVPRGAGTSMLVTADGQLGTIGGGALEYEAVARARSALRDGKDRLDRVPLGPGIGQCCGGSVTVLTELWDTARLDAVQGNVVVRALPGQADAMSMAVKRTVNLARAEGRMPTPGILDGWMIEPVSRVTRAIWVWGAGHVGRALVGVLAPLPDVEIYWIDSASDRFPDEMPDGVERLIGANPAELVTVAPDHAEHLVLTYSHALDLEICHRVLGRAFGSLGLIGSSTKRARFRSRLAALGHSPSQIDRMICPIGDPGLGKHPQAIAIGVANAMMRERLGKNAMIGNRA